MQPRRSLLSTLGSCSVLVGTLAAQSGGERPSLAELKALGARHSRYLGGDALALEPGATGPDLATFRVEIAPILEDTCTHCHGPDEDEAGLRIDQLDPDLFEGDDVDWWLDVLEVLSNGEMPPPSEAELADAERGRVIEWLSHESQAASVARRASEQHTPYRRLARYEYDYALQDLLGLPFRFGGDLPPDPVGHDGFENSSDTLHLTGVQFRTYLESAREALRLATVQGERPAPLYWSISMRDVAAREWAVQDERLAQLREEHAQDPAALEAALAQAEAEQHRRPGGTHYLDPATGRAAAQRWAYDGARFAWAPSASPPQPAPPGAEIAVLPAGQILIVELGDQLPDRGTLRVRVRAARLPSGGSAAPGLQLIFGWQASNDSQANVTLDVPERVVTATPDAPQVCEWDVPLSQVYPRNGVRGIQRMGDLPSPSEFLKIRNSALSGADVALDLVEVSAPVHDEWPTASHRRIFFASEHAGDEPTYAREVVARFLERAWRRAPSEDELARKLALFAELRPRCATFEDAVLEVLATGLSSPHFLFVGGDEGDVEAPAADALLSPRELATRLSLFLWCSLPDDELRALADDGRLAHPEVLATQVTRLLADPRARRLSEQFVRQWLNLELLDFLHVDPKAYPGFAPELQESMRAEPIAFFDEVLRRDLSVLEFVHADFALVDERLARHYGLAGVVGNDFRRVELPPDSPRGGLLTQAGLLAMNSDGVDSHPLKRGIWMLERLLDDPPAPPPPAVPQIDLADPRIAQMTLKERIEDHRNHPACMSCHAKIDPWGIAFEQFDAVGAWRTEVRGRPVDATSTLFNGQTLEGMDGLQRFLLELRQDQFVRALCHKLATFALGRPLGFGDQAALDEITAEVRRGGDGLATLVRAIATSPLFRSR